MTTSSVPLSFVCQHCGATVFPKRRGAGTLTKFCNKECYRAARRAKGHNGADRRSPRYDAWHAAVAARDVACQGVVERNGRMERCGATTDLHAHHIRKWAEHPADRFDPSNGILLCYDCHKARHPQSGIGQRRAPASARVCRQCGIAITRFGKTGLCYHHAMAAYRGSRGDPDWEQLRRLGKTCRTCGIRICDKNTSGYCRHHAGPSVSQTKRAQSALTTAIIAQMRERYAAGNVTFQQLGQDYKVSTWSAWHAVRGTRRIKGRRPS